MTRKTPPSVWMVKRIVTPVAVIAAGVFALGVTLSPARNPSVAVIGDRADEMRSRLGVTQAGDATVTIVLLNSWEGLGQFPDIAELCGEACHTRAAPQITLTQMHFGATRRVVIFHLPSFHVNPNCIADAASMEMSDLWAYTHPCGSGSLRKSIWILPMGLGRIS